MATKTVIRKVGTGNNQTSFTTLNAQQQAANLGRIPDAANLEAQSSKDIAELLNPPTMFQDTSRISAELGAGRGISSSAAAYGTGLRMTDEERLKRISLGQNMLTSALGRNPTADPAQAVSLSNQAESIANQKQAQDNELEYKYWLANRYGGGSGGGGGGYRGSMAPGFSDTNQRVDASLYVDPAPYVSYGTAPENKSWAVGGGDVAAYNAPTTDFSNLINDTSGLLPLYPGGPVPGQQAFDEFYDQLVGGAYEGTSEYENPYSDYNTNQDYMDYMDYNSI